VGGCIALVARVSCASLVATVCLRPVPRLARRRARARLVAAAILLAVAWPVAVRPQAPPAPAGNDGAGGAAAGVGCPAPALLPAPAHWLSAAVRRAELAGPHQAGTTATGTLPLGAAVRALEAVAADGESPAARSAAAAYLGRVAVEYPHLMGEAGAGCGPWLDARVEAGYLRERGRLRPGFGYQPEHDWTGAVEVEPVSSPAARGSAVAGWGRLGGRLELLGHDGGVDLLDAHLAADLGDVVVWAGRRPLRYGPAAGGGLVLGGGDALVTGVGAVVTDPVRLPWVLGLLGPVGMESFFSRAAGGERVRDPWFWGARLTAAPHPRFRIGASRGTMYGGEGNTPVTLRHTLQMLMGMHSGIAGEFDNHFGAVDLRYRPPGTALDLYLEWGMNDSAGAWWAIPARLLGVQWSALPFAPGLGVGAEFVHFPRSCCGNPIWYRNWQFRMGWTNDGELLAHPLGGHGQELAVRVDAVLAGGTAVGHARAFHRRRGDENLFHPQWTGGSVGGEAALQVQPGPGAGAVVRGFLESGDGWRAARVFTGLTWSFGGR
jgi:hypothetical protein